MSFLQLSNGFLNELVDYIMRDWKKTVLRKCEEHNYLQTKVSSCVRPRNMFQEIFGVS